MTIIIGHRGACGYAPENTLASFRAAKNLHLSWVEFDVMLAKCGTPVIIHDQRINRTTNGTGNVVDYNYQQLLQFDAGSWFGAQYANEKILPLSSLLHFLHAVHLSSVIEVKPYPGFEEETARATVAALTHFTHEPFFKHVISSFSLKSLRTVRALMPEQAIAFAVEKWRDDLELLHQELHLHSFHIGKENVTEEIVNKVHAMGLSLFVFTVNDVVQAQALIKLGVDGIFSDFPDRLINL